ncbi:MAG: arginine deiminase family protein [Candidatus Aminicenantales bacterium]
MVRNEGERLRRVIVCAPRREYFKVKKLEIHNIGEAADRKKAMAQHRRLQAVLRQAGARVINLMELPGHPNSVFARDAGLVTPRGYIKLRLGLPTRRGEEDWMALALENLGVQGFGAIEPPGTVEGGDVIIAGKVAFIGLSERSNKSGVRQLSRLLMSMDYEVRILSLPAPHLHIGGAMSIVGPRTVFCCRRVFPKAFFAGFEVVEIPCPEATSANVITLGDNQVIVEEGCPGAAGALKKAGFHVRRLDLSEFVKGRGGPTCLIMPVDRWESEKPEKK